MCSLNINAEIPNKVKLIYKLVFRKQYLTRKVSQEYHTDFDQIVLCCTIPKSYTHILYFTAKQTIIRLLQRTPCYNCTKKIIIIKKFKNFNYSIFY